MRRLSSCLLPIALITAVVLLRATIPAGYMPGNLLAGEFVRLCRAGLPPGAFGEHHANHGDDAVEADGSCPVGFALQIVIVADTKSAQFAAPSSSAPYLPRSQWLPADAARSHEYARAPPPAFVLTV